MTSLVADAADEPDDVALSKELPLKKLERDLERQMPDVRGIDNGCIAAAAAGDAPNPAAYVEGFHGAQFDQDVADHYPSARRALQILGEYSRRAAGKLAALHKELKGMDRQEKVPSDARAWTGFERFRVVFLGLLSLTLLAASIQQLAQLLLTGGITETLVEGLRFAFVPLVAVAGLEIVGQRLVVGEKAQRNYARGLAAVCICAALCWAYGFTSQYGASMSADSSVDLNALLGIDEGSGAEAASASLDAEDGDGGTFVLLVSVISEIFGAALIWLVLFSEFEEHAPWRRCVSRGYKDTSREVSNLALAAANAARLEARYQGRVDFFEHGRRDLINKALKDFHEALGDRKRTNEMTRRLRDQSPSPPLPKPLPHPRLDRDMFPPEPSRNGEHHEE